MNEVNETRPPSAERVPTLTEVVELGLLEPGLLSVPDVPLGLAVPQEAVHDLSVLPVPMVAGRPAAPDAETVVAQVLADLNPRITVLLETRLREALAPALARAADGLIRDAGSELSATLRALVEEAVAQALRRQDGR